MNVFLSVGAFVTNGRIVYFGLSDDPRTPKGVSVDGVYFDGSKGYGPEK